MKTTHRHSFVRADGSRFMLDIEIDLTKLSRQLVLKMLRDKRTTATRIEGAVVAQITDFP